MVDQLIVLGGCFWGTQRVLASIPGVQTRTGYAGGDGPLVPTYYNLDLTGDAEAVEVVWDGSQDTLVSIVTLVVAKSAGDPSPGHKPRYRRAILCPDSTMQAQVMTILGDHGLEFTVGPVTRFVAAEAYHQDYYDRTLGPL